MLTPDDCEQLQLLARIGSRTRVEHDHVLAAVSGEHLAQHVEFPDLGVHGPFERRTDCPDRVVHPVGRIGLAVAQDPDRGRRQAS